MVSAPKTINLAIRFHRDLFFSGLAYNFVCARALECSRTHANGEGVNHGFAALQRHNGILSDDELFPTAVMASHPHAKPHHRDAI